MLFITLLELKSSHVDFMKNKIIFGIFIFISCFILIGVYSYICFKIIRGTIFIYKDPNKAKTLNNIDFYESLPDVPSKGRGNKFYKLDTYGTELPWGKNYFLRKLSQLKFWTVLVTIIIWLIPVFLRDPSIYKTSIYNQIMHILIYFLVIMFCILIIYYVCELYASFWCYYVKLFQLLGVFRFLENDFNKTINSHNYFPISIRYYEKLKEKNPKPKSIKKILKILIKKIFKWILSGWLSK
ncbi:conserved hypothetical protein [Candidatus Phytoplasma mali]|uniref:Uncharacterized protein n=1 Tax=Phytoplasma mali (strain AT) TaxID=482235 RepID=B3R030_PHYMT|nr:hypothetical protein [Candidatus Phytoplasma mali]CAP18194.1 conserved hypothetical protein [Candidatus Phytoplasma mali]CAP18678.1 conserved hypothetical protein [Candidatus Phytoplasma mali]